MNFSIVKYIIGYVLVFEAAFMALPCVVALIYQESEGWAFVITGLVGLFFGLYPASKAAKKDPIDALRYE